MTSVIIVGSGVAGTQVARQLLGTGNSIQIIMFEAGPDYENGKYRRWLVGLNSKRDGPWSHKNYDR